MLFNQTRVATFNDALAISTLILAGSADGTGVEGTPEELDAWRTTNAALKLVRSRIEDPNILVLVSEMSDGNESIGLFGTGYGALSMTGEAYIGGVACSIRHQGIGRSIIEHLVRWLLSNDARSIEMTIAMHNLPMQALATKLGFSKESEFTEDRFYRTGFFGNWFLRI